MAQTSFHTEPSFRTQTCGDICLISAQRNQFQWLRRRLYFISLTRTSQTGFLWCENWKNEGFLKLIIIIFLARIKSTIFHALIMSVKWLVKAFITNNWKSHGYLLVRNWEPCHCGLSCPIKRITKKTTVGFIVMTI